MRRIARLRRSSLLVNAVLAMAVIGGGVWAYVAVAGPAAGETTTDQTTVAVAQGTVTATVSADGTVESASTASATFGTSGTVEEIRVEVGEEVKEGQLLAKVDDEATQRQLDSAQATLEAAEDALDRAEENGEDTSSAESEVDQAELDLEEAQEAVDGAVLKAPMAGTVIAVNGELGGSSGGSSDSGSGDSSDGEPTDPSAGGAEAPSDSSSGSSSDSSDSSTSSGFIEIADLSDLDISASVAEADATQLETGQAATITWNALADTAVTGELDAIDPNPTTSNDVVNYGVTFGLEEIPDGARLGQTVEVSVTVGEVENAINVSSAAITTVGDQHTVTVVEDGIQSTRVVEVGLEGDLTSEIVSGLAVGEQVVVTATGSDEEGLPGGGFPGGGVPGGGGGPPDGGGGPPAGGFPGGGQ